MSLWWCLLRQVGVLADVFSLRSALCHLVPFDLSSSSSLEVSWLYDWRHPRGCRLGCRILVWSSPSSWEIITYSNLLTYIFWDPSSSTWCHHKPTDNSGKHTGLAGQRHSHGYRCISSHLTWGLETPSLFKAGSPEEEGSTDTLHRRSLLQSQGPSHWLWACWQ